ncbi:arf-GAP with dual PH domain-containing protein 1-like isoform X3 [Homarus americanus]|uniref:arf-GAP with dual PH domain-containing protein 1-like isoform X3 n=1 Tax=Homarus americanus TaxID=6706 RepID=UPI001C48D92D|nr:arf-GAP with dual PH domain-containing protein 1-like isoform X3 [Homarus americanus]
MGDRNSRRICELVKQSGNSDCADCGFQNPEWSSFNIGVFLCTTCATWHRRLGTHVSKVKSLKLDKWDDEQVEQMEAVGNLQAKQHYEQHIPACYRIPHAGDPPVLLEQWIRAKYERQEFIQVDKQTYIRNSLEGTLMKKAKDENKYFPRKFVISDNSLKYYSKENSKEPKTTIQLSELNVCLAPAKMNQDNGMQLSYMCDGSTRHIYVYHESGEIIIQWYMAIRSIKLNWLMVAYPSVAAEELVPYLTNDFVIEGWLSKTGPNERDAYRKRWFILDDRKLMYHEGPLDSYPRGEIFLGYKDDNYSIKEGVPRGCKDHDFSFSLITPERTYVMSAPTSDERSRWMNAISTVMERSLRPQDNQMAVNLVRKRPGKFSLDIFSLG